MPSLCRVRTLLRLLACFAFVIPAFGRAATTNVSVGQGGTNSVPSAVTIQAGDTVKWTWAGNNHSATSGNLTPDGLFNSGVHITLGLPFRSRSQQLGPIPITAPSTER